jgi:tetratricopeptide (TPR) repeat protein
VIEDTDAAIALVPMNWASYLNRGTAYRGLKQFEFALECYTRAIELNSTSWKGFYNRGQTFYFLCDYHKALADFEIALTLQPQNTNCLYYRAICFLHLGEYSQALRDAHELVRLNSEKVGYRNIRGLALLGLEHLEAGKAELEYCQEYDPNSLSHRFNLERYRLSFEQPDEAMALRLDVPMNRRINFHELGIAYLSRGVACWLRGKHQESLTELEKAFKLEPYETEVYFWIGMASASLGNMAEAERALDQALRLGALPFFLAPLKLLPDPYLYEKYYLAGTKQTVEHIQQEI